MWVAILALVILLMVAGVAGSVLPFLPGTPLILVGALLYAWSTDFEPVGTWHLLVLLGLTALAYVLDYISGALGARRVGASRWAMAGAVAGAVVGIFFGPFGILLGPIVGAVGFELLYRKEVGAGVKSGLGAVMGMFFGTLAKFSLAIIMVALFTFWTLRG